MVAEINNVEQARWTLILGCNGALNKSEQSPLVDILPEDGAADLLHAKGVAKGVTGTQDRLLFLGFFVLARYWNVGPVRGTVHLALIEIGACLGDDNVPVIQSHIRG